jgi:hypothetical protein
MAQSGRNVEMAAGLSSNMSPNTSSLSSAAAATPMDGPEAGNNTNWKSKDGGGFGNANKWTPPTVGFNKGGSTFTGRLANFGFRGGGGGGGMLAGASRLNR